MPVILKDVLWRGLGKIFLPCLFVLVGSDSVIDCVRAVLQALMWLLQLLPRLANAGVAVVKFCFLMFKGAIALVLYVCPLLVSWGASVVQIGCQAYYWTSWPLLLCTRCMGISDTTIFLFSILTASVGLITAIYQKRLLRNRNRSVNIFLRRQNTHMWEWSNGLQWSHYSASDTIKIERAFQRSKIAPKTGAPPSTCRLNIGGNIYEIDFTIMCQRNVRTKATRNIRRNGISSTLSNVWTSVFPPDTADDLVVLPPPAKLAASRSSGPSWSCEANKSSQTVRLKDGKMAVRIRLRACDVGSERSLDVEHFNIAAFQFAKFFKMQRTDAVRAIDVYTENTFVRDRFVKKKDALRAAGCSTKEIYVFHGTSSENIHKVRPRLLVFVFPAASLVQTRSLTHVRTHKRAIRL